MGEGAAAELAVQQGREGVLVNPKRPKDMPPARYRSLITENKASKGGQVYGLRQQGLTYEQIGELIDPPVSKERVRQILARHERLLEAWGKLKEGKAY